MIGCRNSEYPYECSCGEWFREIEHAKRCKKCRVYAPNEWCEEVYDVRSGTVVWKRQTLAPLKSQAPYAQPAWEQPKLGDVFRP